MSECGIFRENRERIIPTEETTKSCAWEEGVTQDVKHTQDHTDLSGDRGAEQ